MNFVIPTNFIPGPDNLAESQAPQLLSGREQSPTQEQEAQSNFFNLNKSSNKNSQKLFYNGINPKTYIYNPDIGTILNIFA